MRLSLLILLGCLALTGRALETGPARLTGSFLAVGESGQTWDSNYPDGSGTGTLEVPLPAAPAVLELYLAGFPDNTTLRFSLLSADQQRELKLSLRTAPGPAWCLYRWDLPAAWQGKPAVLLVEDNSPDQWIGLDIPKKSTVARFANWFVAFSSLAAVLLTALPFFTALVLLPSRFRSDPALHVTLALVASGIFALAVFFGFYFSHRLGLALVIAGLLAALPAGWLFLRRAPLRADRFHPLLATLALAALVIATLYLYGGSESPPGVPAGRLLSWTLPQDNQISELFADKIFHHEPLRPFLLDWLTSDRPPLQTGYLLVSRPWVTDAAGRIAAALAGQLAVYAGLWVLLGCLGVARRPARLCLLACATSGFFLVNTLFTWPKLLPAGFLLCLAGLLFRIGREHRRATGAEIFAAGACAALAMLAHGGSFFGLVALGVVHLLRGGWRDHRLVLGAAATALLLFAPWMAYQHWADPPGDRLLKYHLANRQAIDPRGALTVIAEAYRQTPAAVIARNKWSNVYVLAGDFTDLLPNTGRAVVEFAKGDWARAWWRFGDTVRGGAFFHLLQSLGFLVIGLPFLWLARRQPAAAAAGYCVRVVLASGVVWCTLMFGPEGAVIHQGTYLTGALLHVAAVLGLILSGRLRLIRIVLGLHLALWLGVWVLSPAWNPRDDVWLPTWEPFWLIIWVAAAAGLAWSGARLAVGSESTD